MATVKIKFRASTVDGGQGSIFCQVIHNRVARQQKTATVSTAMSGTATLQR